MRISYMEKAMKTSKRTRSLSIDEKEAAASSLMDSEATNVEIAKERVSPKLINTNDSKLAHDIKLTTVGYNA